MKKAKYSKVFLEELRKIPIVQVACEKSGLSRQSVYRWKKEDQEFAQAMEEAIADGTAFVNDMSETQLMNQIKAGNLSAVRLWLTHNHERYSRKLKIEHSAKNYQLDEEQKLLIKEALSYSTIKINNHE